MHARKRYHGQSCSGLRAFDNGWDSSCIGTKVRSERVLVGAELRHLRVYMSVKMDDGDRPINFMQTLQNGQDLYVRVKSNFVPRKRPIATLTMV